MAGIPKEHNALYFDKLCRTQKGETVLSLIQATYHAKRNLQPGQKIRDEVAKRLVYSYNLFRDNPTGSNNGAGSYVGTLKQFESQYTIGHELCIWKNSDLDLTDLALSVAENEITIKQYFDVFFFNYFQPVSGKGIHVLYYILDYMLKHGAVTISKEDIPIALGVDCPREMVNALCNFLSGTTYIHYDDNELKYVGKEDLSIFIENCNTRYIGESGLALARNELDTDEKYAVYITSFLISNELQISDTDAIRSLFINWLEKRGLAQTYIRAHLTRLNWLSRVIGKNIYSIEDVEEVNKIFDRIKSDPELKQKDEATHNHYSAAIKNYASFLADYLNEGTKIKKYSVEWFRDKSKEFEEVAKDAELLRQSFINKYGVDQLNARQGEELLNFLFIGGDEDNLCHELEYVKRNRDLFGSVSYRSSFNYPLHKKDGIWFTGSAKKPKSLSLEEAIVLGTSVRDQIVRAVEEIQNNMPVNALDDYLNLYAKLYTIMPDLVNSLRIIKYFHMLFPELMPVYYNKEWQLKVLAALGIAPSEHLYGRLGQIAIFAAECKISNIVFSQIFKKYCICNATEDEDNANLDSCERVKGGRNIILYGVPGAGKSHTIDTIFKDSEVIKIRVVFHPDYTYSDFVGQIMPREVDGTLRYPFVPGPFTKALEQAEKYRDKRVILIIEEINRGNAAAIFGDIFQLLDREQDSGESCYKIMNFDIAKYIYGDETREIRIPSNMFIICTMNTSDQNVFTLDTAFQRRWEMRLVENKFNEDSKDLAEAKILDTTISWGKFNETINELILEKNQNMTSTEDKRLGTHFINMDDILMIPTIDEMNNSFIEQKIRKFPEKVIKYLWDDAFKFARDEVFNEDYNSLEKLIAKFSEAIEDERFDIFNDDVKNKLKG